MAHEVDGFVMTFLQSWTNVTTFCLAGCDDWLVADQTVRFLT